MTIPAEQLILEETAAACVSDLCSTCLHLNECVYARTGRDTVLECEFFETESAPEVRGPAPVESAAEPDPLAGLCVNCEHRAGCTLPRPAGGVWHCEEYS